MSGAWIDNHNLDDRYKVIQDGQSWAIVDMIPPVRAVAWCADPTTAAWVRDAIDHHIHGAPGSTKRRVMQGPP